MEKRISEELNRVKLAIRKAKRKKDSECLCQLYAVQSSLEWMLNPRWASTPTDFALAAKVRVATGTLAG